MGFTLLILLFITWFFRAADPDSGGALFDCFIVMSYGAAVGYVCIAVFEGCNGRKLPGSIYLLASAFGAYQARTQLDRTISQLASPTLPTLFISAFTLSVQIAVTVMFVLVAVEAPLRWAKGQTQESWGGALEALRPIAGIFLICFLGNFFEQRWVAALQDLFRL